MAFTMFLSSTFPSGIGPGASNSYIRLASASSSEGGGGGGDDDDNAGGGGGSGGEDDEDDQAGGGGGSNTETQEEEDKDTEPVEDTEPELVDCPDGISQAATVEDCPTATVTATELVDCPDGISQAATLQECPTATPTPLTPLQGVIATPEPDCIVGKSKGTIPACDDPSLAQFAKTCSNVARDAIDGGGFEEQCTVDRNACANADAQLVDGVCKVVATTPTPPGGPTIPTTPLGTDACDTDPNSPACLQSVETFNKLPDTVRQQYCGIKPTFPGCKASTTPTTPTTPVEGKELSFVVSTINTGPCPPRTNQDQNGNCVVIGIEGPRAETFPNKICSSEYVPVPGGQCVKPKLTSSTGTGGATGTGTGTGTPPPGTPLPIPENAYKFPRDVGGQCPAGTTTSPISPKDCYGIGTSQPPLDGKCLTDFFKTSDGKHCVKIEPLQTGSTGGGTTTTSPATTPTTPTTPTTTTSQSKVTVVNKNVFEGREPIGSSSASSSSSLSSSAVTASTPTAKPFPEFNNPANAAAGLVITDTTATKSQPTGGGGQVDIAGRVQNIRTASAPTDANTGTDIINTAAMIVVEATFFDEAGNVIEVKNIAAEPNRLGPGESGTFNIVVTGPASSNAAKVTYLAQWVGVDSTGSQMLLHPTAEELQAASTTTATTATTPSPSPDATGTSTTPVASQ
jgi:hypothetical protein